MTSHLTKDELASIYEKISPFEFKDKLISIAKSNSNKKDMLLDAGRGNPNWTASTPREAFFTFGQFAVLETKLTWDREHLAGMPQKQGISNRFRNFIKENATAPGIELLENIFNFGINKLNFNEDDFLFELTDGIIGDNYPYPDKMLIHIEKIVHDYLLKELCNNKEFDSNFDVFAVEGGTAAMCYVFDSLVSNKLLNKNDKIALMTPIFTPYLEIPHLPHYTFNVVNIHANEVDSEGNPTWQFPLEELEKLKDTDIKVLFVVNPNNPASVSLNDTCINNLKTIVKEYNKDLMIITDDVYCTFVDNFKSLISELPYNTLCVYSLSKYFGVTGWRLGTILLNEKNIFNELLLRQDKETKESIHHRYEHLCLNPEELSFMDRIVADSRQVALNHTAGLSTPQQVQMAFFCAFALLDNENKYKNLTREICEARKKLLYDGLELEFIKTPNDAAYYTELNILNLAKTKYNEKFMKYIENNFAPLDFLYTLAKDHSVILLNGDGFASSKWSLRVSLANLETKSYLIIGQVLTEILDDIFKNYKFK